MEVSNIPEVYIKVNQRREEELNFDAEAKLKAEADREKFDAQRSARLGSRKNLNRKNEQFLYQEYDKTYEVVQVDESCRAIWIEVLKVIESIDSGKTNATQKTKVNSIRLRESTEMYSRRSRNTFSSFQISNKTRMLKLLRELAKDT